jgi:hypothetical protein
MHGLQTNIWHEIVLLLKGLPEIRLDQTQKVSSFVGLDTYPAMRAVSHKRRKQHHWLARSLPTASRSDGIE